MCPNEREAVFYYEECMLRYSHKNILSTLIYHGGFIMTNPNNISSHLEDRFGDFVSSTMNQAAEEAVNNSRKFYKIRANWTALRSLYALVQCTPDLRRQDCLACLQYSINGMPLYKIGGRLLWPSCNSRYELYPFYNESVIEAPPPLESLVSTPPMASPSLPGKGRNSNVLVVAIVVPIIVGVLLFIAGYCFLAKRKKKSFDTAPASEGGDDITTADSLQLDYRTIQTATNDFAESNKIGRGGFGEVFKAWRLWNNRTALDLVDPLITDNCQNSEVVRCIHIGLLCVQEDPVKRPTISTVFMMLTSNTVTLPVPRQPGFFIQSRPGKDLPDSDQSTTTKSIPASIDDESITDLYPR
ncbi:unnamed protein product [Arabidopsis arenosa]|uniref:Gnk2-homologous domain-containing protein n=1 Tax=Arabidopsis arenosa TaxID=38785 RepID=A0A8S2AVL2_ARAAE|nr:unnamed protein product [Arabidopsis arenosa]